MAAGIASVIGGTGTDNINASARAGVGLAINIDGGAGDDSIIGTDGNDTITGGAGIDIVNGSDGDDTFVVSGNGEQVAGDIIIGGTGTNGISINNSALITAATFDFDNISDVLSLLVDDTGTSAVGVTFSAIAEGGVQTVVLNASALDSAEALTVTNGAASSTTTFSITGGAGNDVIVGSNGADSLSGGAGNDSITGGDGADRITTGDGADSVILVDAAAAADTVYANSATGLATVIGFDVGGTANDDNIGFSVLAIEAFPAVGIDLVTTSSVSISASDAVSLETITGAATIGAASDEVLVIDGNVADTGSLETALEIGGGFEISLTNAFAAGDVLLVAYDNGINTFIAAVTTAAGSSTTFATGDLTAVNLVTLVGITDATTVLAGDYAAFIA